MAMKLGFIGETDLAGVEADAKFAKEHGFEGLEYNDWGDFRDLTAETVGRMRSILDRHRVGVSMLGLWGWNHLAADPKEQAEAHQMLDRAIGFAQTLGAEVLVTGGGDIPGAPLEEKVAQFARVFPKFLDKLDKLGIRAGFYAVHGNSFFDSIHAYEKVWEQFPQVGIKFDPANWLHHGDDYLYVVRRHGPRIVHVHVKEHLYMGGELASQPAAGMGDVQWGKVMAFLHEHGYNGHLSIEPHGALWGRGEMRRKMILLSRRYISQFIA
jgi:sugar phosphate isomerase/epimerase